MVEAICHKGMGVGICRYSPQGFHPEITNGGRTYLQLITILFHHISLMTSMDLYINLGFLKFFIIVFIIGLTLIERATHLEEKAARLKHEGLGKIKISLAGCNTSSILDTLEGTFGFVDQENVSTASTSEMKESTKEEVPLSSLIPSSKESGLIGAELVFPMQTISHEVAGIPESFLPLHGPETQLCYRCQFPDCVKVFSQKVAACNHIHHDHLNVALACLYCSGKENPKM